MIEHTTGSTSTDPFITKITFTPSEDRVLLVLENYIAIDQNSKSDEILFTHVTCEFPETGMGEDTNVTLIMSKATTTGQFDRWVEDILMNQKKELVVITSDIMPGCGKKERLPFLVNSADIGSSKTFLIATPLEWHSVALTLSIRFGKASTIIPPFGNHGSLIKRFGDDDDNDNDGKVLISEVNLTSEFSIPSRLQLLPLSLSHSIDVGLPFDIPFLPQEDGQNKSNETKNGSDQALTVTCVDCSLTGEVLFHGKIDIDSRRSLSRPFQVEKASIGMNVTQDMLARVELEFATGETPVELSFQQGIFPLLHMQSGIRFGLGFSIPGLFSISPYFDYALGVSVSLGAPKTNVTFGGELRVPKGSHLRWDIADEKETNTEGWDVDVTTFPVKVNSAPMDFEDFSLGVNFTSVPSLTLALSLKVPKLKIIPEVPDVEASIGARVAMLLPRVYTKSTILKNVTSSCTPPEPEHYTYFPTAVLFESGIHTALYGELFATIEIPELPFKSGNMSLTAERAKQYTFLEHTYSFPNSCLLFGDSKTRLGEFRNISTTSDVEKEQVYDLSKIEQMYLRDGEFPPNIDIEKLKTQEGLPEKLQTVLFGNNRTEKMVEGGEGGNDSGSPGGDDEENAAPRLYHGWLDDNGHWTIWIMAIVAVCIGNGLLG